MIPRAFAAAARPAQSAANPVPQQPARWLAQRLAALAALLGTLALPGCALLHGDQATERAPAATGASAAPEHPAFDIRVDCDDKTLRELVARHNQLQRYRAIADLDDSEFARVMAQTEADVRNLLATEGYFNPTVQVRREGAAVAAPTASNAATADAPDGTLASARPTVVIGIEPGPATTVQRVTLAFEGDLASSTEADAVKQREGITGHWGLTEGERFTQSGWSGAKNGALRRLVERRYLQGRISYSLADVRTEQNTAALTLRMDSGPVFHLGPATVRGAKRYPPELAERLSWLKPGDVYDQKKLVDAQQRLAGSGYYDSAFISVNPEGDPAAAPVSYRVTEAKRHKLQLGVGYSTDNGPRLTLEHRDNTAFGSSWRTDTKLNLDRKQPLLQAELTSLPDEDGWRRAGLARTMRQDDGVLATLSQTVRAGVLKTEKDYDRNIYVQYEHANVTGSGSQAVPDALLGDGAAVSVNYAWTGRYFDNLQLPKRGHGLGLDLGLGLTTIGPRKPFARVAGRWLGFVPLGGGASRLQLRADAGAVLASDAARLPATNLFRTGGDATVRGYSYRSIGVPVGGLVAPGRYQAVGSIEWQRPILQERYPGLLEHTLFIDVGGVANEVNQLRAHWGVGTGVRLITPVGPMQLDIAYGLKSKDIRLHMNVGFVF